MAGRTRIIDLSVPIMNYSMDTHDQTIHYLDHAEVARQRAKTYGIAADRLPVPHLHTASEQVTLSTHAASQRELGVSRRFRASGVSAPALVASHVAVGTAFATAAIAVIVVVGRALYGLAAPRHPIGIKPAGARARP